MLQGSSIGSIRKEDYGDRHCQEALTRLGRFHLSCENHSLMTNGVSISMRPMEFRLLHFLMTHPDQVHPRKRLLKEIWGDRVVVGIRTVDVHIRRLRVILAPFGVDTLLRTIHCRGYLFSQTASID